MRKLGLIGLGAVVLSVAACVPLKPPPPNPGPGAPVKIALGDSVAALVGDQLPVENDAVGGTTACDTAANLPAASRVFLHVGGHSWGLYTAAQWQACALRIIDHYGAANVWVATAPLPGAIYCGDGAVANGQLDAAGITHADLTANPDYELRQRLADADAWKLNTLPGLRPGVHVVNFGGVEHYPCPDDIHPTPAGAANAAARVQSAGF